MSLRLLFMYLFTPTAMFMGVTKPFIGLLMLVFLYYFRPEIWGAPDWFRPIFLITMAVSLGWLAGPKNSRSHALMNLSLVVLLGVMVSAFMADASSDIAISGTWILAKLIIIQFLTMQLVDTPKKINMFLWANVVGMLWTLKTIIAIGSKGSDGFERVNVGVGQGGGANYLGLILVMTMPFLFMRMQNGTKKERTASLALAPLYVLCTVLTGSRAALICMAAISGFIISKSNQKALGVLAVIMVILIVAVTMPESEIERFKAGLGMGEKKREFSAQSRLLLWSAAFDMFRESPVLGKGMDNFQILSPRYVGFFAGKTVRPYVPGEKGPGFVTHSTWMQTLAEGGMVVSVPFFGMFLMAFVSLIRAKRKRLPRGLDRQFYSQIVTMQGLWIAFCMSSTFGSHIKIDFLWWYMGLTSAIELTANDIAGTMAKEKEEAIRNARQNAWRGRFEEEEPATP